MKNLLIFYTGLVLILPLLTCNDHSPDSVKAAKEVNQAKRDSQSAVARPGDTLNVPSRADAVFLVNAASGGMLEVQLGHLAQTASANWQVKNFGEMMIRDHSQAGEKLRALSVTKNVMLPAGISDDQQKEREKLKTKKGREFDRAYIDLMVSDHKADIRDFEKAADNASDTAIKFFARNSLTMLHIHLDSAVSLQTRMRKLDAYSKTGPPLYEP